jgi:hypothetical protein
MDRRRFSLVGIAAIIALIITGLSLVPGTAWSGFVHPVVLFVAVFLGILALAWALDRAARNASGG